MKPVKLLFTAMLGLLMLNSCKKDITARQSGSSDNSQSPSDPASNFVETVPGVQTAISVSINSNCAGFYQTVPSRYDSGTQKYPVILFLHGVGEIGNGGSDLKNMLRAGLPRVISKKNFPASFEVGGKRFSFIVIAPQFKKRPTNAEVNSVLQYALRRYRIDTSRIYVTGLSLGGGVTWEFAAEYGKSLAAIAPVCGGSWPDNTRAQNIASDNLPVWAFHNNDDPTVPVSYSRDYVAKINSHHPLVDARLTTWPTGGHDAWTKTYDPAYKENGMNLYEWMLHYSREKLPK